MNHASLFSGIGGFDLAAEWMGWNNVLHVERDPFCQRVLKHHFPNSLSFDDVKTFDGRPFRGRVDILTGGFPCQPYSSAGKRLGKDDERHLWPEMCRIISEIAPAYVVGENVRGLLNWNGGVVFEEVCADLEALGYEVWTGVLPAAGVGAPHRRDRVWWVAANSDRYGSSRATRKDAGDGRKERLQKRDAIQWTCQSSGVRVAANATCFGNTSSTTSTNPQGTRGDGFAGAKEGGVRSERTNGLFGFQRDAANADGARVQGQSVDNGTSEEVGQRRSGFKAVGDAGCVAIWDEFPTEPPICGRNDGLPRELDGITFSKWRAESIKAYGNAIVPQVAFQIFTAINQTL